ncbi:MAG: GSCFA domain-containing protein [Cytophagaceae bacterium]
MSIVFRTEVSPGKAPFSLLQSHSIMTMGSCFADTIGAQLLHYKLDSLSNPFGTTFNPISIHHLIQLSLERKFSPMPVALNDVYYDFQLHSDFSSLEQHHLYHITNERLAQVHTFLKQAGVLFLTYGTAWVYRHIDSNTIVNNCHKQPGYLFKKELIKDDTIVESFTHLYNLLKQVNPSLKIVLTVSPVRHLKDTLPLNNVSKAQLLSAVYTITQSLDDCYYFPAYELLLDDLRDYRFYADDRLHPSKEAQQYIWTKFRDWCVDKECISAMEDWDQLHLRMQHAPQHPNSVAHQKFLQQLLSDLKAFPHWNTEKEQSVIQKQLPTS